jgi:hypothetical protein
MLMNPKYQGMAVFNQRTSAKVYRIGNRPDEMGNDHTRIAQEDDERGRTRWNAPEDWIVSEGAIPSPVPADLARRAHERIERQAGACTECEAGEVIPRESRSMALLAGFIICTRCGRYYRGHSWAWKTTDPLTGEVQMHGNYNYLCPLYEDGGEEACARFPLKRELVEEPVIKSILASLSEAKNQRFMKSELKKLMDGGGTSSEGSESARYPLTAPTKSGGMNHQLSALEAVEKALADFQENIRFATPEERRLILTAYVKGIKADVVGEEVVIELY